MAAPNPQSAIRNPQSIPAWHARLFPNQEWTLLLVLLFECAIFSVTGNNFLTTNNGFEIVRLIAAKRPGQSLTLEVWRNKRNSWASVT